MTSDLKTCSIVLPKHRWLLRLLFVLLLWLLCFFQAVAVIHATHDKCKV